MHGMEHTKFINAQRAKPVYNYKSAKVHPENGRRRQPKHVAVDNKQRM